MAAHHKLGYRSKRVLAGHHKDLGFVAPVQDDLAKVTVRGLHYCEIDFTVLSTTLRNEALQAEYVRLKKSRTMDSKHLPQDDGKVHAVDLGALIGGRLTWREEFYFDIAEGMQKAARELDVPIIWGGCWRRINGNRSIEELHWEYVNWCRTEYEAGRRKKWRPFFDGPHFELPRGYIDQETRRV